MNKQKKKRLPIGFWLKRADELLTLRIDETQSACNLSRLEWQMLNVIRPPRNVSREHIAASLTPFADNTAINSALNQLANRGLVFEPDKQTYMLTEMGETTYQQALTRQKSIRATAMMNITEHDYAITLRVLQQLVENLESNESA